MFRIKYFSVVLVDGKFVCCLSESVVLRTTILLDFYGCSWRGEMYCCTLCHAMAVCIDILRGNKFE